MLNHSLKKEAIRAYEQAYKQYEEIAEDTQNKSISLFELRSNESKDLIYQVESLFSQIANKPKEFDKAFSEYKAKYKDFEIILNEIRKASSDIDLKAGGSAAAGIAAGAGVASLAPTAAMAIATTFGTASTGTAISSLSGAAATRAALAWLGGGALSAGGGGMAAGQFFLTLASPVGWMIGGLTLVGSALIARRKNTRIATEAIEGTKEIITLTKKCETANVELDCLIKETREHIHGVKSQINLLNSTLKSFNFSEMNNTQKDLLISIKNHVESLSVLIKKKVVL